jgi:Rhodanese-related sulfurtransferase
MGGLKKWKIENRSISNNAIKISKSSYVAIENKELVKDKKQIDENILNKKFKVIDARSKARFDGKEKEPREGIRSGSIPNSYCLPFKELVNKNYTFKEKNEISKKFKNILKSEISSNVVFSCGSGVTAAVLALAYSLIDNTYRPVIYDGSWAEYGKD